jgi:uncharacterized coiled-coil protein SlyX
MAASLAKLSSSPDPSYIDILAHVKELEKTVVEQAKIIAAQASEIAHLKKELVKYENPHTPSSAKRFKKKPKHKDGQKKRGAPKGHKGATRPTPKPDEYVGVFADHCEKCGSNDLEEIDVNSVVIEDLIYRLQQIKAAQFDRSVVKCHACGHEFTAKHEDCPQNEAKRQQIPMIRLVSWLLDE